MIELIEATQKLSVSDELDYDADDVVDEWALVEAIEITRTGWENVVKAEFLGAEEERWIVFKFQSANPVLHPHDIFSARANAISVFDIERQKPRRYQIDILDTNLASDEI